MSEKSNITYKIEIDYTNDTVALKEVGRKGWLTKSFQVTPGTVAGIMRDAAYNLLERAHYTEHSKDFIITDFNVFEQICKMTNEHKSFLNND